MKIREIAKQSPLKEGAGAVISKLTPAYGVADAAYRAKEGDWLGAGIAGVATGLGLVPPVGPPGIAAQAGSIGLDAFNVLRDIAKEKGGWKNLGNEFIKAARDRGNFDQAGMGTMYESFAELDQLDEAGQLDEGLGWEAWKKLGKYGSDVIDWAKNLRKSKPDVPTTKPPLSAAEREAAERAEELAAREAEKQTKVVDRRGQPKQDEVPIINKDAPAAPSPVEQPLPKWNKKTHKSEEDYINSLSRAQAERYQINKQILATQGAPVKPGWVRRGGAWVLDNPIKTGLGLYAADTLLPDVPDYVKDPVVDFVTGKGKAAANATIEKTQQKVDDRLKALDIERQRIEKEKKEKEQNVPDAQKEPPEVPGETPLQRERRLKGWPQSKLDSTEPVAERRLAEKYLSYKAEAQTTKKELNYDELIRDPNVRIMLDLISRAEGNTDYDTIVGGGKFKDFSTHPNTTVKIKSRDKIISSDAAGRYQIMGFNWGPYSKRLGLKDFSPESQDKIAVAMLADRGALDSVLKGDFKSAVKKTGSQWTSLPSTDIIQGYGPKDWKWVNTQLSDIKKSYGQTDTDGTQVARVDNKVSPVSEPKKDAKAEAKPGYYAVGDSQAQGVAGYGGEGWNKSMARTGASILDPKQFQAHLANIERIPRGSVVAISGGGNDINSAKPEVIVSQMNKLIAAAKARGLQVVHLLPTATDNPKTQQLRDQLRQAFLKGQTLVPIVDLGQASKKDPMNLHLDPKGYKVIAQNITNMLPLGSAVAGEVPTDGMGGPEKKVAGNTQRVPTAAELAKINQRVKNFQDPVKELEKIIAQAAAAGQKTDALKKELDQLKQDYEKDKAKLAADEPGTVRIGPVKITAPSWLTGKDDKAADKPADKEQPQTYTITDKQGKLTTYARNEKGQWVSPSGKILSMPGDASSSMPSGFAGGSADAWDARLAAARGQKDKAVDNTAVDNKTASNKAANKTTQNQQSATGRVQPYVGPQGVKSDSDLSKPAKGVSTATAPPKSEKPADKTDTGAAEKAKKDAEKASAAAAEKAAKDAAAADKKNQQRAAVADVPDANATAKVNVRKDFERAFAAARAKQVQDTGKGSGGTFTWTDPRTGKEGTFTTDYGDEVKSKTKRAATVDAPDITSQDTQELARRASQFKAEPNEIEKIIKDRLDKEVKSNSSVDIDPNASNTTPADSGNTDSLPPVVVTAKPDQANVLRSTDGTPVKSGTGEPWGTGTSTKDDLERAKAELQKKIDDEKAKKELQKISPDLSEPAAQDSFQDKWSRGIEWLTGKKIPDPKEMDKIRVPESVNTELKDILWLAGRTKK